MANYIFQSNGKLVTDVNGKLIFQQPSNSSVNTNGLVMYFDAASNTSYPEPHNGATWFDLSGNEKNGTLYNTAYSETGNIPALTFNGSSSYASLPTTGLSYGMSGSTISVWTKVNSVGGQYQWFVAYGTPQTAQARFIGITRGGAYCAGGYGGSGETGDLMAGSMPTNTWLNLVAVYDGTTASIYINGSLLISGARTWNAVSSVAYIGRQVNDREYLNGSVAQAAIYNRALSGEEVLQNFNATKAIFGL